jgi:putative ABC transport system permease protein
MLPVGYQNGGRKIGSSVQGAIAAGGFFQGGGGGLIIMKSLRRLLTRLMNWAMRRRDDERLREEIANHIELQTAENVRAGMTPREARRQAVLKFGSVEAVREDYQAERGILFLETLAQDVRYALRMLARSPGFAAVAILTLALGIGANAAIFSVVNAVLLRPLQYAKPGELVVVPETRPQTGFTGGGMSWPTFEEVRDHNNVFTAMAGFAGHALTLTGHGEPADVSTISVTGDFFTLFGTQPLLGRTLTAADGERGAAPAVVISEALWRSRFGADDGIVGRAVALDERPFTVVGVMPGDFRTPFFNKREQMWIPLADDPLFSKWMTQPPQEHWMPIVARQRGGVSLAAARAEMKAISARLAQASPAEKGWVLGVEPLQRDIVGDVEQPLLLLLGAVGLVLLIACANLANLLLARATARQKEMAVRIALGAGARRIARQLLTESVLLGLLGGTAGMLLAWWGVSSLKSLLPPELPQLHAIQVDGWVLGFGLALSLATSLVFGLAPVLFATGGNPQSHLRESARVGEGRSSQRARGLLAIAEVSLATILLVAAGLLLQSFARLTAVNPGFATEHVVRADVSLPQFQYAKPQQWAAFAEEAMRRITAKPGMEDAAMAAPLPLVSNFVSLPFTIAGAAPLPQGSTETAHYAAVSPGYFRVMEISLERGRLFSADDTAAMPAVALISEKMARQYFPHENPLGRQMMFGFPPNGNVAREIVGVVSDIRDVSLGKDPGPMMYVPFAQAPLWGGEVVVRSNLSASAVAAAVRDEIHAIDQDLPVTDVETLPEAVHASVAEPRFRTLLLGLFGGMALVLAAIGIYGVVSFSVARRTREIGTRMALGATPGSIWRLVIGESAKLVLLGLAVGVPAALLLSRSLGALLFGVRPSDPLTFVVVASLLTLVALVAAYLPARAAMRVDPMVALRCE